MSAAADPGIGSRLSSARRRLGWNREALAFHSGISWSAIAQVERGRRRNLRPGTLSALAGALGISIDYLVTGRAPAPPMLEHSALLYETDAELVGTVAPFLSEAVERSEGAIAVTSAANIAAIKDALGATAREVEFADHSSWCRTPMSALSGFHAFLQARLDAGAPWVRIVGEPVWAGRSPADVRLWARFESLLNIVFGAAPTTILCPYDVRALDAKILAGARATHPHTLEHETRSSSSEYAEPSEFVLAG